MSPTHRLFPSACAPRPSGVALAYSNSLAGRLCDVTAARGMGNTGCFFGGAVVSGAAILALLAFTVFGELGKEEQVAAAPKAA